MDTKQGVVGDFPGAFSTRDDATIAYGVVGAGPPVVVVNGLLQSAGQWGTLVPRLASQFTTITFDQRNQGLSKSLRLEHTLDDHVEDLRELLDHLGLRVVMGIGYSGGARVLQLCAMRYPERFSRLVLVGLNNTHSLATRNGIIMASWHAALLRGHDDLEDFFDTVIPWLFSPRFLTDYPELPPFFRSRFRRYHDRYRIAAGVQALRNYYRGLREAGQGLGGPIEVPTLAVSGGADYLTPPEFLEAGLALHRRREIVILPGCGHAVPVEEGVAFMELTIDFLSR